MVMKPDLADGAPAGEKMDVIRIALAATKQTIIPIRAHRSVPESEVLRVSRSMMCSKPVLTVSLSVETFITTNV
jgi:predicted nucleotidyltransferase